MTNVLDIRPTATTPPASIPVSMWSSPERGLWVASVSGAYLGMIELTDGRYVASNERGRRVGEFDELSAAQSGIAASTLGTADSPVSMALLKVAVLVALLCVSAAGASGMALFV